MPELPVRQPLLEDYLGSGHFKDVYHAEHPERVRKIYRKKIFEKTAEVQQRPDFLKAEYYLTKLMKMLFPENVADIYAAHSARPGKFLVKKSKPAQTVNEKIVGETAGYSDLVDGSAIDKMRALVQLDLRNNKNIIINAENQQPVFVDSFEPWSLRYYGIVRCYDCNLLTKQILTTLQPEQQQKALNLLSQVEELFLKEDYSLFE